MRMVLASAPIRLIFDCITSLLSLVSPVIFNFFNLVIFTVLSNMYLVGVLVSLVVLDLSEREKDQQIAFPISNLNFIQT